MKVIKEQYLPPSSVYIILEEENLFTRGSKDQRKVLMDTVRNLPKDSEFSTDILYQIADFIAINSDFELWVKKANDASVDYENFVEDIMYILYKKIVTDFYVIKD